MANTIGLRFRSYSIGLGTAFDWFVADQDMPDEGNSRGTVLYRDTHITPAGNTFLYDKGRRNEWKMTFKEISTRGKTHIEHITQGWFFWRQISMVYYGSSVAAGTGVTVGSLASVGQCWGTGYIELLGVPVESAYDLWDCEIQINGFGEDQSF